MEHLIADDPMADRKDVSIKLRPETVRLAKMAAAGLNLSLIDYFAEVVEPIAKRQIREAASSIEGGEEPKPKSKGGKSK